MLNLFIIKNIMETFVQILASVISAVVCYKMAENRKRNPVIGAVCGFFLPIISIISYYKIGEKKTSSYSYERKPVISESSTSSESHTSSFSSVSTASLKSEKAREREREKEMRQREKDQKAREKEREKARRQKEKEDKEYEKKCRQERKQWHLNRIKGYQQSLEWQLKEVQERQRSIKINHNNPNYIKSARMQIASRQESIKQTREQLAIAKQIMKNEGF